MLVDTAKAAVAFAWFKGEQGESCDDVCARLGQGACNATGFQYAGTQAALESIKGDSQCVSEERRLKQSQRTLNDLTLHVYLDNAYLALMVTGLIKHC